MGIKDRDVRDALETLSSEFEHLEETLKEKDEECQELEDKNERLQARIDELEAKVEELEEALAEAYLTDEADDGTTEESDVQLQRGRESDVSDTTDDKATD